MRRIERSKAFKRDYQRAIATPKHRDLDNLLPAVLTLLATDTALPAKYVDHALRAEWKDFRDCQVKPTSCSFTARPGTTCCSLCA
jgi:mRNA interferase YafQ